MKHKESTLYNWSKKELVESLMCAEHNLEILKEDLDFYHRLAEYLSKIEHQNKSCKEVLVQWLENEELTRSKTL